ncbi:MAG TPA: efflux RND transporter periplasmic adaptor subunit [Bradyrhizobium sp.]|nr:efflux RND transporter periplasmic adaptor subunit [Bradyrhizobium sp.]
MLDKTTLLSSLAIDRGGSAAATPARRFSRLGAMSFLAVALGLLFWFAAPHLASLQQPNSSASVQNPPAEKPASGPTALADAGRPSGLAASGYVVARRKATIASEVTGKVVESLVDEGMVVKAGQPLARLESRLADTDFQLAKSRVVSSSAAVAAITADLRDAERIFARTKSLSQKNFASEADLTKVEARAAVLRAQLTQAEAQVETAQLDARRASEVLDQHRIIAPFGGVVVDRSAQPGEMISPLSAGGGFTRTGICTIVDMDSIEVEVDVNEEFIGRVLPDGPVAAVLDAYRNWTIPAYVIAVVPTANREKATVRVRVGFRQKDPRILPEMSIKVTFLEDGPARGSSAATPSTAN